jgi:hypothetical protein
MVTSESVDVFTCLGGGIFACWAFLHSGVRVSAGVKNSRSFHGRDFLFFPGEAVPSSKERLLEHGEPS